MGRASRSPPNSRDNAQYFSRSREPQRGQLAFTETLSHGWESGSTPTPHDWQTKRIGANQPDVLAKLLALVTEEIQAACGIPGALFTVNFPLLVGRSSGYPQNGRSATLRDPCHTLTCFFCPYLSLHSPPVAFADWELGPLESFNDRWANPRFKELATTFLNKFVVGLSDESVDNPALLCRKGEQLDGRKPTPNELEALELALVFALVDRNPRRYPDGNYDGWGIVTADNAELYAWPIDLEEGHISRTTGSLVKVTTGGYKIDDCKLVLRPPLDLHMPAYAFSLDPLVLTGIYETILSSFRSPDEKSTAHQIRVAVIWFAKAWLNTTAIKEPERLVYLKTAFEALTGTNKRWESAKKLRKIFKALPCPTKWDSEDLVWSPEEKPTRTWVYKNGKRQPMTDLEHWFMEFGEVRNTIIHEGVLPDPAYYGSDCAYNGSFFFTGEFLLRDVIKVLLSNLGYENAWRGELYRSIDADWENGDI